MQGHPISLEGIEVNSPIRAKYPIVGSNPLSSPTSITMATPSAQSDASQTEAAEVLSTIVQSFGSKIESSLNGATPENTNSLAPQKVRTERYVKVSVKGFSMVKQKSLFLSWFIDNNGLPDACLLLIPERHPNVIISFKGTHGWIELDTNHCKAPEYEVQFELKLHHALLNKRRYVQNQPIVLRFFLLDKREDGTVSNLGEVLLSVLLMSSKCANRTLIAHLMKDEKQPGISISPAMGTTPMAVPMHKHFSEAPADASIPVALFAQPIYQTSQN